MSLTFSDVRLYSANLRVLYVEDEDAIREQFSSIYLKLFAEVVTASNGEEGLKRYFEHKPDIVISDIRMPVMNGLDMARQIRKESSSVPIVFTTAHNDGDFLLQAIDVSADKYILKPIDKDKLVGALFSVCKSIFDAKEAEQYRLSELQNHINEQAVGFVSKVIDAVPTGIVMMSGKKIKYANKAFCNIIGEETLKKLELGQITIEGAFEQYIDTDGDASDKNIEKVTISGKRGRKVYQVSKIELDLLDGKQNSIVYSFTDVTRLEYQKIKLKHYSEHLEEFFYNKLKKERAKAIHSLTVQEVKDQVPPEAALKAQKQEEKEQHLKVTSNIENIDNKIASDFGEQELKVLRRSQQNHKMSAREFLAEVGDDIKEAIEDLQECDHELEEQLALLSYPADKNEVNGVGLKMARYASVINQMIDFGDLAIAVKTLSEFLLELNANEIDSKKYKQLNMFLINIKDDLRNWRLTNFVEQISESIHYLDASLMSSCLQLQMVFMSKPVEDDDDDLGLDLF